MPSPLKFSYPINIYTNKNNECFEGIGISPIIYIEIKDVLTELNNNRDITLEKALEIVKGQ